MSPKSMKIGPGTPSFFDLCFFIDFWHVFYSFFNFCVFLFLEKQQNHMVFTVFSACPQFAVTCAFYISFSKKSSNSPQVFGTCFPQKSMKKWFQEPTHKKNNFCRDFLDFWKISGALGDPWGPPFSQKIVKKVWHLLSKYLFYTTFSFRDPFFEKVVFLISPGTLSGAILAHF